MQSRLHYFGFFTLIILILALVLSFFSREITQDTVNKANDQLYALLRKQLDKEKSAALRFALVLAQNHSLIDALDNADEEAGYQILSEVMNTVKEHTNDLIRTQIITNEYTIFARSWDNAFAGMPIDEYRPDLRYFQKNIKPRSAIEVGRRLGFKATVPIYRRGLRLGFVEVLQFFEAPTEYFRNIGIDFFALMEERFLKIAIFMQDNPTVGEYIVANRFHNSAYLKELKSLDFKMLRQKQVMKLKERYIFFKPMFNGEGERIGAFVFAVPESYIENFSRGEKNLAFVMNLTRSDLYEIEKRKSFDEKLFKSNYDKEVIYLKDIVSKEDREIYIQEAYDRLKEYSKDELIGLLLNYSFSRKIRGEIR